MERTIMPSIARWSGLLALLALAVPARAQTPRVRIVVNAANPATTVTRQLAEALFLKQRTRWSDNTPVVVLDQVEHSDARQAFSQAVLGRDITSVKRYWQQAVFSGRMAPPAEVATDADVLALVRSNRAAVGYVSATADLGPGVKELQVTGL